LRAAGKPSACPQPYLCHVTQPKLHEQLLEWGLDLSVGQIDALPTSGQNAFSAKKSECDHPI
jgi:hypothetical protein